MTDIEDLDLVSITLSKEERFVKELDTRRVEYYPLKNKNTSPSTSSFDSKEKFNKVIVVSNTEVKEDYTIIKDCIDGIDITRIKVIIDDI